MDLHARRQGRLKLVQYTVELFGQLERVRPRLLLNPQDHSRSPAESTFSSLQRWTDLNLGQILDQHCLSAAHGDERLADILLSKHAAYAVDEVFLPTLNVESRRSVLVSTLERLDDRINSDLV